jgi:hypothetical protein
MNSVLLRASDHSPIFQLLPLFVWYVSNDEWNESPSSEDFESDSDLVASSPAPLPES